MMGSESLEIIDGVIHSIHVRNFFCHDNLEIIFHPNINFIVGRNGSGKSAILTALVVGLGGRAAATNRGTSLSSFVKKGTNSATVEIKIKNGSAKAYKPNVYGNYITIIRNITASGGSSYKTKSASGEVISTKFEEVNAIVTAHDIQVDNPISVLNQDDARSFHSASEKKKYALFRKATNLDQTEANYTTAIENCNKAKAIWKRKNEACTVLEKELNKWTESYKQMQSRDEIENKKKDLQNEYFWSEVVELEKETSTMQAQYNKQNNKVTKIMERLKTIEQSLDGNSGILNTLKEQLKDKSEEKSSLEEELRQLQNEKRNLDSMHNSKTGSKAVREKLSKEKMNIAALREGIENLQSGSAVSCKEKLEMNVANALEEKNAMQARFNTAQNDASQARQNLKVHETDHGKVATEIEKQKNKIIKLKEELRYLECQGNNSLGVYGDNMVRLCERVSAAVKAKKFSEPPRGPVGSYLKVKDREWGGVLEHIIGAGMTTFCVNNFNDSKILVDIMKEVYGNSAKPGITCSKFLEKVHNVRETKVSDGGYMCALEALVVNDPVVTNFLIDSYSLEKILLVPDEDDAMQKSECVENVPRNCAKIVTLDGYEYYPAPTYRRYFSNIRNSKFLHVSTAEKKKCVQAEILELEKSKTLMLAKKRGLEMEINSAEKIKSKAVRTCQELIKSLQQRESAYNTAIAALEHHQPPEYQVLQEELENSLKTVEALQSKLDTVSQHEREHLSKVDDNLSRIKDITQKLENVKADYRQLDDEIYREQMNTDQRESQRQTLSQTLEEEKNKLTHAQLKLNEKTNEVKEKIRKAQMLCTRIENPREKSVVESKLKKIDLKLLSSIRSDGLSKAEVGEKLLEVETKYKKTEAMLKRLIDLISEIKKTADEHFKFIYNVQKTIARCVEFGFQDILKQRGFEGSLEIDYSSRELKISCWGRDSSQKRLASTTDSLSGGERSYSMVALILALWKCVELPFHFLDECDVFMDDIHRTEVRKLLIEHAKEKENRQFVFLTPQSTYVKADRQIKIHRMADPRR